MPNDAYENAIKLNVNKNAKIVIESELRANVRFLTLMDASSRYWSSIHANECVFSRKKNEKQLLNGNQDDENLNSRFSHSIQCW